MSILVKELAAGTKIKSFGEIHVLSKATVVNCDTDIAKVASWPNEAEKEFQKPCAYVSAWKYFGDTAKMVTFAVPVATLKSSPDHVSKGQTVSTKKLSDLL